MSDIWSIIKQGKEKLEKGSKQSPEIDDLDLVMLNSEEPENDKASEKTPAVIKPQSVDFPPWLSKAEFFDIRKLKDLPVFELHEELVHLVKWLEPTTLDKYMREKVLNDLTELFQKELPHAILHPFGSFLTNLALPDSDLDIMVECNEDMNYLRVVEKILRNCSYATRIQVISHARVPIIKFRHSETGIDVDMCFNQESSLLTSCYVMRQLSRYPYLRPMVLLLKYMLSQRQMNDTYHGGIGSFMITILCLSSEQWCIREGIDRGNLANHLLQFFYYYGLLLNYDKLVLCVRTDGGYLEKEDKNWFEEGREFMLSVENPIDPSLDIGKSSYNIKRFKAFCSHALMKLTFNLNNSKEINQSQDRFFVEGIVRNADRYPASILASPFYQKYGKPGLLLPDAEAERQTIIANHMESVKKCKKSHLKRVYELDYAKFMGISEEKGQAKKHFSQKRNFASKGNQSGSKKKYRRF